MLAFCFPMVYGRFPRSRSCLTPLFARCLASMLAAIIFFSSSIPCILADEAALYGDLSIGTWGQDGAVTTYAYDDNGSLISKQITYNNAQVTHSYIYNLENRLVSASVTRNEAGEVITTTSRYTYNRAHVRVRTEIETLVNGVSVSDENRIFLIDSINDTGFSQVLEERFEPNTVAARTYTLGYDILIQGDSTAASDYR